MTLKATSLQDLAPVRRALAEAAAQEALLQQQRAEAAVSYTHLTLPTSDLV